MTYYPKLHDLLSTSDLEQEIKDGYISRQTTTVPKFGTLSILCYTKTAQYEEHWTKETTTCRGLIVRDSTSEVLGRPFPKFFNFGQVDRPAWTDYATMYVTEKMDGSLGICFWDGTRWRIATKGSFESDQARVANSLLDGSTLRDVTDPNALGGLGTTTLFEIIYPENRIVVDYGRLCGLCFITCIDNRTGAEVANSTSTSTPWVTRLSRVSVFPISNTLQVSQAVNSQAFDDREGLVATWVADGREPFRLKFKNGRYLRLHSLLTKMTARKIWAILKDEGHQALADFIKEAPDEFQIWAHQTADRLLVEHQTITKEVSVATLKVLRKLNIRPDGSPIDRDVRKTFAQEVAGLPDNGLMFKLLDGKSIADDVWKKIYPAHETPFMTVEDE